MQLQESEMVLKSGTVEKSTAESFSDRIRMERVRLQMTQAEFGKLAGVKRASQHMYEQSERVPDIRYLQRLADHPEYEIDVIKLLLGEKATSRSVDTGQLAFSPGVLSEIFVITEEFGKDLQGKPLSSTERLRHFQIICSIASDPDLQFNATTLRTKLSKFLTL